MPNLNVFQMVARAQTFARPRLLKFSSARRLGAWRLVLIGSAGIVLACVPAAGPGAQRAEQGAAPELPVEVELRAAPPPPGATPAPGGASAPLASNEAAALPPPPPEAAPDFACVHPPDPELEKESAWSRETTGRLVEVLPQLRRCSLDLAQDDEARITLRLVYAKDGAPISQHVVTGTSNACAVSECIKQELASVRSPRLLIDKASIDLTLSLARGAVPERVNEPVDPLMPDEVAASSGGCVDAEVARLSQTTVREIVSKTYDDLQVCYSQALARNHSAEGKVTFEFVIGQNGGVADAWAREATLHDCAAINCMLERFRALSFPEPVGRSVRVIYPISYVLEQPPVTLR